MRERERERERNIQMDRLAPLGRPHGMDVIVRASFLYAAFVYWLHTYIPLVFQIHRLRAIVFGNLFAQLKFSVSPPYFPHFFQATLSRESVGEWQQMLEKELHQLSSRETNLWFLERCWNRFHCKKSYEDIAENMGR